MGDERWSGPRAAVHPAAVLTAAAMLWHVLPSLKAPIIDTDVFWQIWAGRIWLDGRVPHANGLSWTAPDTPWVSHEMLVQILYASVGTTGARFASALAVIATSIVVLQIARRTGNGLVALLTVLWMVLFVDFGIVTRALTWGNLLLAVEMALLTSSLRRRHALCAALFVVWANVHGSWVFGLGVLALYSPAWALAGALLTLVNPYGTALWDLVWGYGAGTGVKAFVHREVFEWMPLAFGNPWSWLKLALMATAGVTFAIRRDARALALWAACLFLMLRHQRFTDLPGIVLAPFVATHLARRATPVSLGNPFVAFVVGVATFVLAPPIDPGIDQRSYPSELLDDIPRGTRLYNDFILGSWLGLNGFAVFMDARNDCYPYDVMSDGIDAVKTQDRFREVMAKWRIETIVTQEPNVQAWAAQDGWRVAASSGKTQVLRRD
jgi:hypothetical protein